MTQTPNYDLKKPAQNDFYNVDDFNDNFDIIDDEIKKANTEIGKKADSVEGKGFSTNDYTTPEKEKLSGIADNANNYVHPSSHPASMITQDSTHRFVSDTERTKLDGIAKNANNYVHPSTHSATMISQNSTHRFVTDSEKSYWNGKANKSDITGGTLKSNSDRLQGKPISTTAPEEMQSLRYVGGYYVPSNSIVRGYCSTDFKTYISSIDFILPFAPTAILIAHSLFTFSDYETNNTLLLFDGQSKTIFEPSGYPTRVKAKLDDNVLTLYVANKDNITNGDQSYEYVLIK